jgi:hypothetical protein
LLGDANPETGAGRGPPVAATSTNRNQQIEKQSKIEIRKARLENQNTKKAA